ncbi:thiamine phosphate synthase [bacterium]|nr:thiamine phosphate synthase [bacterium]MCI0602379.1 thiamine phosphate synthase [bacterium]
MKQFQYCLISDRTLYDQPLPEVAAESEKAGVHCFLLREKDLSARELLFLARELRPLLHRTRMIVHGSLEVALASNADGVHLQKDNIPISAVRSRYRHLAIGYSAHSFDEMKKAEGEGADYVFISPVFEPLSKQSSLAPLGLSVLTAWNSRMGIPVFALGGVSSRNLFELRAAGCAGAAGISLFVQKRMFTSSGMVI